MAKSSESDSIRLSQEAPSVLNPLGQPCPTCAGRGYADEQELRHVDGQTGEQIDTGYFEVLGADGKMHRVASVGSVHQTCSTCQGTGHA